MRIFIIFFFTVFSQLSYSLEIEGFNLLNERDYSFGACEKVQNIKYPKMASILNSSIDIIFEANLDIFQKSDIDRNQLCIKVTDDSNVNAYVIGTEEHAGVIYFHKKQFKKYSLNFSKLTSVIAHELAHILMDHGNTYQIPDLTEAEVKIFKDSAYYNELKFTLYEQAKAELETIENDLINRLIANGFFTAWQYLVLDEKAVQKMSLLNPNEKNEVLNLAKSHCFDSYNLLASDLKKNLAQESMLKRVLINSYDKRMGSNQYISYQEREADKIGFYLYKRSHFQSEFYFTFPEKTIFSFLNLNKCKKYSRDSNLSNVTMADSEHPSNCYRQNFIENFLVENEHYFLEISIDKKINEKYKKELFEAIEESQK